ncbi:PREDICTED: liver-expressed antimicrobial peptide 2 [Nanorana parkeri]|uniref:liver-expressed antimicrobial peptide 2 n=1 Tax=Nanorana parkeri TaxID=125878 RepID=UPI0008547F79|nr:PREDICTED: liver-expressed antimicrobial peptide 2 [Nanorana parkeri]
MIPQLRKWMAIFVMCIVLIHQLEGAPMNSNDGSKTALRLRRMTPFWRGLSLRPVGASCRDDTECLTRLCRNQRCSLKTFAD